MIKKNSKKRCLIILNSLLIALLVIASFDIYKPKSDIIDEVNSSSINNINTTNNQNTLDNEGSLDTSSVSDEVAILYSDYIKTEGNIDNDLISYLDLKLQCIPEKLLSSYFNQGGTILLTDKDISKTYYSDYNFGNTIGIHDARKNIIFISNSKYAIDNALIHEFGHVLDSLSNWDSMEKYFLNVFEKEKDSFKVKSVDNHYKLNEREFFAEVFQEYILNPDTCESSAPQAFEFVNKKIKSLK